MTTKAKQEAYEEQVAKLNELRRRHSQSLTELFEQSLVVSKMGHNLIGTPWPDDLAARVLFEEALDPAFGEELLAKAGTTDVRLNQFVIDFCVAWKARQGERSQRG